MNLGIFKEAGVIMNPVHTILFLWVSARRHCVRNKQMGMEEGLLLYAVLQLGLLSSYMPKMTQCFLISHELTMVLGSSSPSVTMKT